MELVKRPTVAKIKLDNLRHNAKIILSSLKDNQQAMAIIKANAYGHGAIFVARTLENCGVKKFGVATFNEGLELREQGIRSEIFVLNGILGPLNEYSLNRLYPVIFEMDQLKQVCSFVNDANKEFKICIKFDTGMGRLGFAPAQIDEIVKLIRNTECLNVACVMTHLAKADEENQDYTDRQFTLFRKLKDIISERGIKETAYCICNSAAILDDRLNEYDWVRPGIAMYGAYPNVRHKTKMDLKPVMELKTKIISLKTVMPNSYIGYGCTFETKRESQIAILPVGYADGYPRLASNRGHVLVKGQKAPIVGRVSMDLMAIDVTDISAVALYDDVVLMGSDGNEMIRAEDVASWAETISYEVLCGISLRVPRVYEGL